MPDIEAFIAKWKVSGGAERANYAAFLIEVCDLIGVDRPDVSVGGRAGDYTFERPVRPRDSAETLNPKRIDLYKRHCFILEAKQSRLPEQKNALPGQLSLGIDETPRGERTATRAWDVMMRNARKQAEGYVFLLDADHVAPPFIIVCDVGHCFELYADFTGTGRAYTQFPDRNGYRVFLDDLRDEKKRALLKNIWEAPQTLDPAKNAVKVTREIAARLAAVSKALEEKGNNAEDVAHFLMRCLFTMFAEDVDLLPKNSFQTVLEKCIERPETFALRIKQLWSEMEKGAEFSHVIEARIRHFNGGLFKNTTAFELAKEHIGELLAAAKAEWKEVDPAIFGTLLEQALDPAERRKLGAHYTPRAYVQRLVEVTVMEPLRADWEAALTKAEAAKEEGKDDEAVKYVRAFHDQLTHTRVLDPACGTGNFLYVALELMKQLEGEVLETLTKLGDEQGLLTLKNLTVDPHLFLGLELNPRAAAIAELVVWIGYLQWHYRNTTGHPQEPILRAFENINFGKRDGYDAVLTWDGYPVPKVENGAETYPNARRPAWPEAEFIVGNPPFLSNRDMRGLLTDGYVDCLKPLYREFTQAADFVLFFWLRATEQPVRRIGLVSTSRIRLKQNNAVFRNALRDRWFIRFAIPDHDWPSSKDSAKLRVAFISLDEKSGPSLLVHAPDHDLVHGTPIPEGATYKSFATDYISPNLSIGLDPTRMGTLSAGEGICHAGVKPYSGGFLIKRSERDHLLQEVDRDKRAPKFMNGHDVGQAWRGYFVIDVNDLEQEEVRTRYPQLFSYLVERVKPGREVERNLRLRREFWRFEANRDAMRQALLGLPRFLVTLENSPQRYFSFLPAEVLPDQKLRVVTSDDAYLLAVLSSRHHELFSVTFGGRAGKANTPVYNTECFTRFPCPDPPNLLRAKLRHFGEELDATRKRVQAEHPDLTLTGLYNVLEKVRANAPLSEAEEQVKTRGLVLVLKDLHDQIDAATAEAYGWPADLSDEQILERLVALNAERAKEEAQGFVRWLRPEYQIPRFAREAAAPQPGELDLEQTPAPAETKLPAFPTDRYEQPLAVEAALAAHAQPIDAAALTRLFKGKATAARQQRIAQVLTTLARYGRVIALDDGRYAARRAA